MAQMQGRVAVPPSVAGMMQLAEVEVLTETLKEIDVDAADSREVNYYKVAQTIKVKTLTGKEMDVDVYPMDLVHMIKDRIQEKVGIPPEQQRLILGGKQLDDGKTVAESNVKHGCVVHLVLALRGGGISSSFATFKWLTM